MGVLRITLLLLSLLQALAYAVDPPDKSDAKCSGGADGENGFQDSCKNLAGSNIKHFHFVSVFQPVFHARALTHARTHINTHMYTQNTTDLIVAQDDETRAMCLLVIEDKNSHWSQLNQDTFIFHNFLKARGVKV